MVRPKRISEYHTDDCGSLGSSGPMRVKVVVEVVLEVEVELEAADWLSAAPSAGAASVVGAASGWLTWTTAVCRIESEVAAADSSGHSDKGITTAAAATTVAVTRLFAFLPQGYRRAGTGVASVVAS